MLTAAYLRKQLAYDPLTGVFRWKVARSQMRAGDIAGSQTSRGLLIRIDDRLYKGRRLAWLYMKGTWPKHVINCRNGDPSDIRWVNLRQITQTQRQASIAPYSKFGVKGVWVTKGGKFVAEIKVARQKKYLGSFNTIKEANAAYAKAAKEAFGNFARAR